MRNRNKKPPVPNPGIEEGIQRAGGKQQSLAEKLGVDQCTISTYRTGKVTVPLKVAIRMEKKLGVERWKTRPDEFGYR